MSILVLEFIKKSIRIVVKLQKRIDKFLNKAVSFKVALFEPNFFGTITMKLLID